MTRITLDLHVEGESIAGRVTSDGSGSRFSGWLGLFAVIDRLVADNRPGSPHSAEPSFGRPLHRRAGTGRTLRGPNGSCAFLITGPESAGSYTCLEVQLPPGHGFPSHVHQTEGQTFYVLEGQVAFGLGTEVVVASTGDFLSVPRGCPHRFHNQGSTPARLLTTFVPARVEEGTDAGVDPGDGATSNPFDGSEAWLVGEPGTTDGHAIDRPVGGDDRATDLDEGPASSPGGAR